VSDRALGEYRAFVEKHPGAAVFTLLDLLAHRDVSGAIAERLSLKHESPQAIVVKGGKIRAVLNHSAITARALEALLVR
jgi:bacillithiol system protein YtxJ